ncbi:MAG: ABC transporter permease, partial [Gemmatimonadetes bacterium]|nr:ABC transporter permease [Gemmatimonadota bacterium]
ALAVARWGGDAVHQVLLPNVAFTDGGMGSRLLIFLAVATVLTALFAGTVPALQASRTDTAEALKTGGQGAIYGRSRTRVALLVAQAALSVILLVGACLFVQSLREARTQDLGFDATRVAAVRIQWNETLPGEERQAIFQELKERAEGLPTVQEAGLSLTIPFWSLLTLGDPRVPGLDSVPNDPLGRQYAMNRVGAGYFEAMGLSILQGRPFRASDEGEGAAPVAVVSYGMARAIWPETSPIGECMLLGNNDGGEVPCTTVVGVVEDHNLQQIDEEHPQFNYFLNPGHPAAIGPPQALMVRTTGPAQDQIALLRSTLVEASSRIRFVNIWPLQTRVERQLRSWKLGATMFTIFGILALVVAAGGLYSVLAFDVALRRPELGIRSALGAGVPRLVRSVLVRAVILVAVGVVIGMGVALAAAGFVEPLLYRVSPTDPTVYLGVAGAMLAIAALAGSIPAWRASRVDPREALQAE